jgi:hypothetical protein
MSEWKRGKTTDLLTIFMNDPEARKDPRIRAIIRRLRAEHRQMTAENAETTMAIERLGTENYTTKRHSNTTRRRKTASGSNRRKTRSAIH